MHKHYSITRCIIIIIKLIICKNKIIMDTQIEFSCNHCKRKIGTLNQVMTNNSHECFKNYETVYVNEEEKILYGVNNCSENNVNDVVNENFELPLADASNSLNSCSSNSSTTTTSAIWTRKATSLLISLRSKYENNFNDSTTRNEQVWLKVCKDMEKEGHIYTATQVENKFKYLKKL